MSIHSLHIHNFRNICRAECTFIQNGLNLFYGQNGSGKTSVLEAIYYLGLTRSFRTHSYAHLINNQSDHFLLHSNIAVKDQGVVPVGIERTRGGSTRIRIDSVDVNSMVQLANMAPIRVMNTQLLQLIEGGPNYRRKFIDWGLFYQSSINFMTIWRYFERALKQRNSLLKNNASKRELDVWSYELLKYGLELHQARLRYLICFEPILEAIAKELLFIQSIKLVYQAGWDAHLEYEAALFNQVIDEYRWGYTLSGPHRADFEVIVDGHSAKHYLSRGQQKLLVCAMIIAQGRLLVQQENRTPIYLIDDLPAELDEASQIKLLKQLSIQSSQIVMTAIDKQHIVNQAHLSEEMGKAIKLFHVEHGQLIVD